MYATVSHGDPVARKIPFDDPETLNYIRVGYVSAQLLVLTTYYYMSMKVCAASLFSSLCCRTDYHRTVVDKAKERPVDAEIWYVYLFYQLHCSKPGFIV